MGEDEKKRKKKNKKKSEKKYIKQLIEPSDRRINIPRRAGGGRKPSHVLRHNFNYNYKPEPKPRPKVEKPSYGGGKPWTEPSIKEKPKVIRYEVDTDKLLKQLEKYDEKLLEKVLKDIDADYKKQEAETGIKTEIESADKESLDEIETNKEKESDEISDKPDLNVESEKKNQDFLELGDLKESETETDSKIDTDTPKEALDDPDVEPEMTRDDYLELEADSLRSRLADELTVEPTDTPEQAIEPLPDVAESVETPALEDYGAIEIEPEPMVEPIEVMPEIEPVIEPIAPENEMVAKPVQDAEVEHG